MFFELLFKTRRDRMNLTNRENDDSLALKAFVVLRSVVDTKVMEIVV